MTTVLYEDEWVTLTLEPRVGLLRYTRSDRPYTEATDLERSYAGIGTVAKRVTPGLKLLLDIRRAPPRNDAAYEAKVKRSLDSFARRFVKHAVLVQTAVGKLQSARLASERGTEIHVFTDEAAALAYLGVAS